MWACNRLSPDVATAKPARHVEYWHATWSTVRGRNPAPPAVQWGSCPFTPPLILPCPSGLYHTWVHSRNPAPRAMHCVRMGHRSNSNNIKDGGQGGRWHGKSGAGFLPSTDSRDAERLKISTDPHRLQDTERLTLQARDRGEGRWHGGSGAGLLPSTDSGDAERLKPSTDPY